MFHSFCSTTECTHDGREPRSGLIQAANGNYVGTTVGGGPSQGGILYEITPAGKLTLLYNFCSQAHCADGGSPDTPPIQAANGNFYGTAAQVIYEVTPTKQFTNLYTFCSGGGTCVDGAGPLGLLQGTDGNFYGTTSGGGTSTLCGTVGCGVVFELSSAGEFSVLYDFCSVANCTDGGAPNSALTQDTNGMFYGPDAIGGAGTGCLQGFGCGAIYSYSAGLAPFVTANPKFGVAGKVVNILGNNLTGTTSVTFNGTAAKFQIISNTYLKAQVPAGVTTGTIEVTTPSGTLNSNVAFVVP